MVPIAGLTDHVTAELAVPVTVAVNWRVCAGCNVALLGEIVMDTKGVSVTVADPVADGAAWLIAVIVTFCWTLTREGAVYSPATLMEPTFGEIDHVTL